MLAVGCGGERHAPVQPAAHPSVVQPAARPSVVQPVASPPVVVPRLKQKRFLADLKAIDRALTADRETALSRALEICYRVYDGNPDDAVRAYARTAYSSGTVKVSSANAREIVAKVKKWICSDAAVHRRWES
jgi:hypothetical protein